MTGSDRDRDYFTASQTRGKDYGRTKINNIPKIVKGIFMTDLKINLNENVGISESISTRTESDYLIVSNRKKCQEILKKVNFDENDFIDFLISLHLVLEVGLNTFFRHVSLNEIQKGVDKLEIIKNIDEINFISKATLFIYNSRFNFEGNISDADRHHNIIKLLKVFSEPRNKLLHGHSISTIFDERGSRQSGARIIISKKKMKDQIVLFQKIMEGLNFYFNCLQSNFSPSAKETLKNSYLDDSFLNLVPLSVVA